LLLAQGAITTIGMAGGSVDVGIEEEARLAPFNPTSAQSMDAALRLLELSAEDELLDVGCGDGRFLVAACDAHGCTGRGIEWDSELVARARRRVEEAALADMVTIVQGDATKEEWGEPSAVFLYLVPDGLARVRERVVALLRGGARIATNMFSLPSLLPVREESVGLVKVRLYTRACLPKDA